MLNLRTCITDMRLCFTLYTVISNKFSKFDCNINMIVYFALVIANCCYEISIPAFMIPVAFYDLSFRNIPVGYYK